ncbi:YIP1 family protein [Coraliomargarita parva]|uniref:YIP1 family protein n=1 Tax=Coraliomargarita parva TaxID=3014050 RepID=UPI0022B5AC00|nr:YIP1 family protein [Coraliomargarita parva]
MTRSVARNHPLAILYQPRRTVQGLLERKAGHGLAVSIAVLFGVVQSLRAVLFSGGGNPVLLLVAGAVVGLAGLYFFAWLLRNFARWFGGHAEQWEVRLALGLGLLPWTLLFGLLPLLLVRVGDAAAAQTYYPLFMVGLVYGYVILLLGLSSALRLTVLKTFFCLVVATLVSIFPLTLVAQLIFGPAT